MKYAIVENELHSLQHIQGILENLRTDWTLSFTSDSVSGTLKKIDIYGLPDLLFLDIELNDGNCFKLFESIKAPVPVIFTTAYDDFCLKAFKVHSLDYILKPITTDALLFAIRKFESLKEHTAVDKKILDEINEASSRNNEKSGRILIPSKDGYRFVEISDIAWVVSDMKCVVLIDHDGKEHLTTFSSLNDIEELLPGYKFFRVSRSVIASIDSIAEVKKSFNYKLKIRLSAGKTEQIVEVGTSKKKEFLNWFGSNNS